LQQFLQHLQSRVDFVERGDADSCSGSVRILAQPRNCFGKPDATEWRAKYPVE
jgi:hypothetical protein